MDVAITKDMINAKDLLKRGHDDFRLSSTNIEEFVDYNSNIMQLNSRHIFILFCRFLKIRLLSGESACK
jgi:hypothetical protein